MCPLGHLEHPRAPNLSVYLPGDKRRPQACNTQPSHDALQLAFVGRLGQRKPSPERRAYGFPAGRGPRAPCARPEGPQPPGREEAGAGAARAWGPHAGGRAGRPVRREGTAQGGLHGRVAGSARGRHRGQARLALLLRGLWTARVPGAQRPTRHGDGGTECFLGPGAKSVTSPPN